MVVIVLILFNLRCFKIVIVKLVFFWGFVFVFSLLKRIKLLWLVLFKILIICVIWLEKVDRFCLIDCLLLIFVKILLNIVILLFLFVNIGKLDCFINCVKLSVFSIIVLLLVLGLVMIIVVKFWLKCKLLVIGLFNRGWWILINVNVLLLEILGIVVLLLVIKRYLVFIKLRCLRIYVLFLIVVIWGFNKFENVCKIWFFLWCLLVLSCVIFLFSVIIVWGLI